MRSGVPCKPGVYVITCIPTGQQYVGGTLQISQRMAMHFSLLARGKHHSKKMQAAFDRYGKSSFKVEPLELIDDYDRLAIGVAEYKWTQRLNPEFGGARYDPSKSPVAKRQRKPKKLSVAQRSLVEAMQARPGVRVIRVGRYWYFEGLTDGSYWHTGTIINLRCRKIIQRDECAGYILASSHSR